MNTLSLNNTSSIILPSYKCLRVWPHLTQQESRTSSKMNLVVYINILRGRPRECRDISLRLFRCNLNMAPEKYPKVHFFKTRAKNISCVCVCFLCQVFGKNKVVFFFSLAVGCFFFKCISNTKGEKIPTIKTIKEIRVLPEPPEGTQSCQPIVDL